MNAKRMAAVVDTHTSGAPTRIIVGGGPLLKGRPSPTAGLISKKTTMIFAVL